MEKRPDGDYCLYDDALHCRYKYKFIPCEPPVERGHRCYHLFDGDVDCGMIRLSLPKEGYFCTFPANDPHDHYRFWRMPWAAKRPMPFGIADGH